MKRPSTDCHSAHDEVRPAKTRQRSSNVAVTRPSAITVNDNEMHAGIEPGIRHEDSGPDLDQLPHTKPKATAYLNSRAGELSQREITEPSPLQMFKNPYKGEDIIVMAQLIFQKTKSPARFVEEVMRSIFVPEMRKLFTEKIQKLFRKHARTTVLSTSQQKKLDNGYLRLQEWETSSQLSSGLFGLKKIDDLIEAINNAMDETLDMKWLDVLRPVFEMTASTDISGAHREQWRNHIGSALKENQIDWVMGIHSSFLTAKIAQRIVSNEESQQRTIAMSSLTHTREITRFKDKGEGINFGCKFPLKNGLPDGLVQGFKKLQENTNSCNSLPNPGLINHYKKAFSLLEELQSEPQVELLCILALTVGMTLDMTIYIVPKKDAKDEVARFAIASSSVKPKRGGARVALLALRMLWYLMPEEFAWEKAKGYGLKVEEETEYSTQRVREATDQYMITNSMLAALGWLDCPKDQVNGSSKSKHMRIASKEALDARLEQLRSLMPKPTDFVREVFQSDDPKWVDQCKAIIKW
ncbi:hypothetical protein M431DRAFT_521452 [Trichoderma harzianum CBS 226.95]|uniref:Uncharacterized protein n=1 Tax=Trichoderma harzianum CBS 226.95 TaxID=983964 RepID=A0A2T4A883_TRIHA|nr:hypothetical protein M431DRAFT_521452 [Trichoderma harzianum CBS 226.95]PTB53284.1 hypothetical protein M431DRAFT_521452 [Trichoderma harzianum CBS 226.95]